MVVPVIKANGSIDLIVESFVDEEGLHAFILDNTYTVGIKIFRGEEYKFKLKTERTVVTL